jgi:UDP-glucose 4-epimerase
VTTGPVTDDHPPRVVLVTGVSRYLGGQVADRLAADPRIERVIGLDGGAVDGRDPAKVLASEGVEAVVHMDIASAASAASGGRAGQKELNVIGTMQLLAACQQAPELRKIVVRSSTAAYGASFRDPAVFTEDTEPRETPRGGFARDVLDIEGYLRGFRRRRSDVAATVLRFAPLIGLTANTSLTRYFSSPLVPTVLGRDPRLQFVHVEDALEVLHRSVTEHHPGTYNVAGAGAITLSQAVRRAGRIAAPVPEPLLSVLGRSGGSRSANFSLDQLDLFVHGRVGDTTALVEEFGYSPRPTPVAFADFLQGTGTVLPGDTIRALERNILASIRQTRAALK